MTPSLPASSVGQGLHLRRCVRHPNRDAAARCPSCQQYFCRECVVEHDGRLLCSDCLRRESHDAGHRRQAWAVIRRSVAAAFGFIVALMGCYHGFNSKGGAQGVGIATTNAVVSASVLILAANYLITAAFFGS